MRIAARAAAALSPSASKVKAPGLRTVKTAQRDTATLALRASIFQRFYRDTATLGYSVEGFFFLAILSRHCHPCTEGFYFPAILSRHCPPWVLSGGLLFYSDFIETLPPLHWGLPSIFQWFYPDIAMHILHLPCHAVTLPHSHNALSLWRSLAVWASRRRVQTQSTIHMHIPWYSFIHWHTGILNLSYIHSNSYILDYFLRSKIILHSLCHSPMHSLDPLYTCTNQVTLLYTVTQTYPTCHIYNT